MKIIRLLSFSNQIPFHFYLGHLGRSYSSDQYSVCGKRLLAIAAMNAELPSAQNGEHNSESASACHRPCHNPFNMQPLRLALFTINFSNFFKILSNARWPEQFF